jgi:hypothetical protein
LICGAADIDHRTEAIIKGEKAAWLSMPRINVILAMFRRFRNQAVVESR